MKANSVISQSIISFSISTSDQGEQSYAIFGGINDAQVVGGSKGMMNAKVMNNNLNTWALEG